MSHRLRYLATYRDLFLVFIWREFSIRYCQSFIGILWAILQPLSMMILFTAVFTIIMPLNVSDFPYPVFFYTGLLPWTFFSSSMNYAIPSLVGHYNLITKIYFPREIIPLAGVVVAFADMVIASVLLIALLAVYGIPLTLNALSALFLLPLLVLFTASMALLCSALNVYYRDVNIAIHFALQLWFFATPVFYSINAVPMEYKYVLFLNPLTFIIENLRRCVLNGYPLVWWQYAFMLLFVVGLAFLSYGIFKNVERRFADVI